MKRELRILYFWGYVIMNCFGVYEVHLYADKFAKYINLFL